MAQNTQAYVGFWVNWSKGRILGATLTVSERKAALLTNGLALFVQLAGSQLWDIIKYASYRLRARDKPHDAFFYQQQAILRNCSSADTIVGLLSISRAWRSRRTRPLRRCLVLLIFAGVHAGGFIVAAIFSASVAMEDAGVLTRSPTCGLWSISENITDALKAAQDGHSPEFYDYMTDYQTNAIMSASDVRACTWFNTTESGSPVTLADSCEVSTGRIEWQKVAYNASCPFAAEMCSHNLTTGAFQIDSGHVNSDSGFGINAPPSDQVTLRKVLTCAPLETKGFTSDYIHKDYDAPLKGIKYYYYGQGYVSDRVNDYTSWVSNFTTSSYRSISPTSESYTAYSLDVQGAPWGFFPIKQLDVDNGDVTLLFLSSNAAYSEPVDDAWFSAHRSLITNDTGLRFYADEPVAVLGCLEQLQLCNPTKPPTMANACTPLTAASKLNEDLQYLSFNLRQNATLERLYTTMQANTMARVVSILGPSYMVAAISLIQAKSLPLAQNQWMLEVMNWADIMMINIQRMVVEFATGPSNSQFNRHFPTPTDPERYHMCLNQRVPSLPHYTFINVLGMAIIFSMGFLIIIVNYYLDPLVWRIERWLQKDQVQYKHVRWILDGTLQLQRVYCQSLGLGKWEYCDEETPTTPPGVMFRMPADFGGPKTEIIGPAVETSADAMDNNTAQQAEETKSLMLAEETSVSPTDSSIPPRTPEMVNSMSAGEIDTNLGDRTIAQQRPEPSLPGINTDLVNSTMPQQLRRWPMGRRGRYAMLTDDDASLVDT